LLKSYLFFFLSQPSINKKHIKLFYIDLTWVPKIAHFYNWKWQLVKAVRMWYLQLIWTIAYWFHGILVEEFYQIKYTFILTVRVIPYRRCCQKNQFNDNLRFIWAWIAHIVIRALLVFEFTNFVVSETKKMGNLYSGPPIHNLIYFKNQMA